MSTDESVSSFQCLSINTAAPHLDLSDQEWKHMENEWDNTPTLNNLALQQIDGIYQPTPLPQRKTQRKTRHTDTKQNTDKNTINIEEKSETPSADSDTHSIQCTQPRNRSTSKHKYLDSLNQAIHTVTRNDKYTNKNTNNAEIDSEPLYLDSDTHSIPYTQPRDQSTHKRKRSNTINQTTHTRVRIRKRTKKRGTKKPSMFKTHTGKTQKKVNFKKNKTKHTNTVTTDTPERYSDDVILDSIMENNNMRNTPDFITSPPELDSTTRSWISKLRQIYLCQFTLQFMEDADNLNFHFNEQYFDSDKPPLFDIPACIALCVQTDKDAFTKRMKQFYSNICNLFTDICQEFVVTTQWNSLHESLVPQIREYYFLREILPFPAHLQSITQYVFHTSRNMFKRMMKNGDMLNFIPTDAQLNVAFSPGDKTEINSKRKLIDYNTVATQTDNPIKNYKIPRKQPIDTNIHTEHQTNKSDVNELDEQTGTTGTPPITRYANTKNATLTQTYNKKVIEPLLATPTDFKLGKPQHAWHRKLDYHTYDRHFSERPAPRYHLGPPPGYPQHFPWHARYPPRDADFHRNTYESERDPRNRHDERYHYY